METAFVLVAKAIISAAGVQGFRSISQLVEVIMSCNYLLPVAWLNCQKYTNIQQVPCFAQEIMHKLLCTRPLSAVHLPGTEVSCHASTANLKLCTIGLITASYMSWP